LKEKIGNLIAIHKVFINRGWGIIGVFGMGLVVANTVQTVLNDHGVHISLFIIYPAGIIGIWILGIIEYAFKVPHYEQKFIWDMIDRNVTNAEKDEAINDKR